jgi:hypothetical protein
MTPHDPLAEAIAAIVVERPAPVGVVRGRFTRVAAGVSGLCPQ